VFTQHILHKKVVLVVVFAGNTSLMDDVMIVGGPVQELVNVMIMFVVITVFRLILSYSTIVCAECISTKPLNGSQRKKVASDLWYGTYYIVAVVTGAYLFYTRGWFDAMRVCSSEDVDAMLSVDKLLYAYHCMQVAFYVNYVFAMMTGIDPPHKDNAYIIHHIITLILIVFSRNAGYMRIQLAVLVVHDMADPFLHLAKLVKFLKPAWNIVYDPLFGVFAVVFFVTRLYVFPMFLIDNCRLTWHRLYPGDWAYLANTNVPAFSITSTHVTALWFQFSFYGIGVLLLYGLLLLHMYWGLTIILVFTKKFNKKMDHPLPPSTTAVTTTTRTSKIKTK